MTELQAITVAIRDLIAVTNRQNAILGMIDARLARIEQRGGDTVYIGKPPVAETVPGAVVIPIGGIVR
jgi:hypothetical protein